MQKPESVEEYLTAIKPEQIIEFERIKQIVTTCVPEASLGLSYGMPAFKYKHKPLIYFGAFTSHMSLFPTAKPIDELKEKLSEWEVSKGTLRYSHQNLIPEDIIKELVIVRRRQIDTKS